MTKAEIIEVGKRFLEHAPQLIQMGNPELMGWRGPDNIFICANCAGRILARGCNLSMIASVPQYFPKDVDTEAAPVHQPCDFCSIQLHTQGAHRDITAVFDEAQRQMILLGLAVLTMRSPGFDWACGETAAVLQGRSMFEEFKTYNSHLGVATVRLTDAMPADAATVASAAPDSVPLLSLRDMALEILKLVSDAIPASRNQSALRAKASGLCNRIDALIRDGRATPEPHSGPPIGAVPVDSVEHREVMALSAAAERASGQNPGL